MKATVEFIKEKFGEFNRLCFDGTLPELPIKTSKARSYLGRYEYKWKLNRDGSRTFFDQCIRINTVTEMLQTEIEDILIHEMIHYYIDYRQLHDKSAHGPVFRQIMAQINERHHRNINVSGRRTCEMDDGDTRVKRHYLCVLKFADGTYGFTLVTQQGIFTLWDKLPKAFDAVESQWYGSLDPYFNRFRKTASKLQYYKTTADDLLPHLAKAVKLVRIGNIVRPESSVR